MHFLEPEKFDNCDSFLEEFGDLKKSNQVENLHKKLGPYLLRRMKEDVELSIPHKEETLIELELTIVQKTYYRAILERNRDFLSKGGAKAKLMNIMMEQRKVCNHPYLLEGAEDQITKDLTTDQAISERLISSSSKVTPSFLHFSSSFSLFFLFHSLCLWTNC
jgi:chromodomain-helicase-DNA-binding protein 7